VRTTWGVHSSDHDSKHNEWQMILLICCYALLLSSCAQQGQEANCSLPPQQLPRLPVMQVQDAHPHAEHTSTSPPVAPHPPTLISPGPSSAPATCRHPSSSYLSRASGGRRRTAAATAPIDLPRRGPSAWAQGGRPVSETGGQCGIDASGVVDQGHIAASNIQAQHSRSADGYAVLLHVLQCNTCQPCPCPCHLQQSQAPLVWTHT
jgi:hypothetical protein